MKKIYGILFLSAMLSSGCSEDFLDRIPKDKLTQASTFSSYDNIKSYVWNLYSVFPAYEDSKNLDAGNSIFDTERHTDLGAWSLPNSESPWIWQTVVVPANSSDYSVPFTHIRAC